jgi:diguanylate cyclase (GGDEF)-like protein/PAS domain S-box-containing protein
MVVNGRIVPMISNPIDVPREMTQEPGHPLFREILNAASDAIVSVDESQVIVMFNRQAEILFGYQAAEVMGRPLNTLIPARFWKQHADHVKSFEAEEVERRYMNRRPELIGLRKNGEEFFIESTISKIRVDGRLYITAIIRDITERKRLQETLRLNEERVRLLLDSTAEGIFGLDMDGIVIFANSACLRILGYDSQTRVCGRNMHDVIHHTRPDGTPFPLEECQIFGAWKQGESVHGQEELFWRADGTSFPVEYWSYPVRKDGEVTGCVVSFLDITLRKQAQDTIEKMAYYDSLTGLPNRSLLFQRLQRSIQDSMGQGTLVALTLMDLNQFREINDTLGHQRGDFLIKQVGNRLKEALRPKDIVGYMGGDEFAVLTPLAEASDAQLVSKKIADALALPFIIQEIPILVEASIGVALCPVHGTDAEGIFQRADVAMYEAKRTRSGIRIYDSSFDHHSPHKLALMGDMRHAIDQDELFLEYQPQVELETGSVLGTEALVRWNHPQRGIIPPYDFIVPAEKTGLIEPLTLWVLRTASIDHRVLLGKGMQIKMSINLSARNLQSPSFLGHVERLLQEDGHSAAGMIFEITEGAIMDDPERALKSIHALREMGFEFSIDDFGTGYSSLSYLKKLPVSSIKIDRSFVMDMLENKDSAAIVRSTIDLARNLDLQVVAEGVESDRIYGCLQSMKCTAAQGYHICKPVSFRELIAWLERSAPGPSKSPHRL